MKTPITLPTIHMNGTSAKMLLEGYDNAMEKVQDAMDSLSRIEFNGRDYYPQGPDAFETARQEMFARHEKLKAVFDELLAIAKHIYCQQRQ